MLSQARATEHPEVRVLALDALARLDPGVAADRLAEADALAATVPHLLDERDRVDAARVRATEAG